MKEIKLFFVNYAYTNTKFGSDQINFHKSCFDKLLSCYKSGGVIPTKLRVKEGELFFVEATNTEDHLVLKYYYKHNEGV